MVCRRAGGVTEAFSDIHRADAAKRGYGTGALAYLRELDFTPSPPRPHNGNGTCHVDVSGLYESLRLLGRVRPKRLLAKSHLV